MKQHQRKLYYLWANFNPQRFEFGPVKEAVFDNLDGVNISSAIFKGKYIL